jgi:hypothetical protein
MEHRMRWMLHRMDDRWMRISSRCAKLASWRSKCSHPGCRYRASEAGELKRGEERMLSHP